MTRKQFEIVAAEVRRKAEEAAPGKQQEVLDDLIPFFVKLFKQTNPLFDKKRFEEACQPKQKTQHPYPL